MLLFFSEQMADMEKHVDLYKSEYPVKSHETVE